MIDKVSNKMAKQPDKKGSPSGPNVKPKQTKQPQYKQGDQLFSDLPQNLTQDAQLSTDQCLLESFLDKINIQGTAAF